jgi:O-antigen/teichoic acid export membrane protein
MRRLYLASVAIVSLAAFPLFLGIAIAHETVVQGILGTAWSPAGPLLVPLALSMLPYSVMILAGPIIWARARVGLELRVQIVVAVFFVLILIVTAPISFTAVAWGVLAMNCVRAFLLTRQALRTIDVSWRRLASALRGALVLASCTAPFIWASDVIIAQDAAAPVGLAANLIAGIIAGTAAVFLFPEAVFRTEFDWIVERYGARMPVALRNLFRHGGSAGEALS